MIIGYVRSCVGNQMALSIQRELIENYCFEHDIEVTELCDETKVKNRKKCIASELSKIGYQENYRGEMSYLNFDNLLLLIGAGKVQTILVDTRLRLNVNPHLDMFFCSLCAKFDVDVIEVGTNLPDGSTSAVSVAIYHDTNDSTMRSAYCLNDIDNMLVAAHRLRWAMAAVFIDVSKVKSERINYQRLLDNLNKYNVIVVKTMSNIEMKTAQFVQINKKFIANNIELWTLFSGKLVAYDDDWIMTKEIHIVAYDSFSRNQEESDFLQKIMQVFINHKTNWSLCSYHYEGHRIQIDEEQKGLEEVMSAQADWDGILVKSFRIINERTAKLEKLLCRLDRDKFIYSMEEGVYLYGKKEKSCVLR